jgi:hypothetical protein
MGSLVEGIVNLLRAFAVWHTRRMNTLTSPNRYKKALYQQSCHQPQSSFGVALPIPLTNRVSCSEVTVSEAKSKER